MNIEAYNSVRTSEDGCVVFDRKIGLLRVAGSDSALFLNGQVSTNTLDQLPGKTVKSCLLNNVGHLIADLVIHRLTDQFWIETPVAQLETVRETLNRFIVREKVEVSELNGTYMSLSIQGAGAPSTLVRALAGRTSFIPAETLEHTEYLAGESREIIVRYAEFPPSDGYTVLAPHEHARALLTALRDEGALQLDDETSHVLRVESRVPRWGRELTGNVIPLEAGLDDAIDFHKGCYMGQEVIARINSRGHTNWRLAGLRVSPELAPNTELYTAEDISSGKPQCKVTSTANSPTDGWIGLGYVRTELSGSETEFVGQAQNEWAKVRIDVANGHS